MKITLPDPSLVLLLGVSGSGKSTYAAAQFAPTEIVSSDHCRALVCDDENDQRVNKEAFEILHLITASRLMHEKLTVIDATNVKSETRAPLVALALQQQIPVVAFVFDFDVAFCLERNAQRLHRVVPSDVLLQQYSELQLSLPALAEEGFTSIHTFTTPTELAVVTLRRKKRRMR